MRKLGQSELNWGSENLVKISDIRKKYILALQEADRGNYDSLLKFVQ